MTWLGHCCCTQRKSKGHEASCEVLLLSDNEPDPAPTQSGCDNCSGDAMPGEINTRRATRRCMLSMPLATRDQPMEEEPFPTSFARVFCKNQAAVSLEAPCSRDLSGKQPESRHIP